MRLIEPQNTILPNGRNYYHEVDRGSDTLVITIGDSWTWGDSLGKTTSVYDDYKYRTDHIYGSRISCNLNSNFINLGFPGYDNIHILLAFKKIFEQLTRKYKKCYVFFTLTESGRELNDIFLDNKNHFDKIRGCDWPTLDSILLKTATAESINFAKSEMIMRNIDFVYYFDLIIELLKSTSSADFFLRYEAWTFNIIYTTFSQLPIEWRVSRNFTSIKKENFSIIPHDNLINERWVDVIARCGLLNKYPESVDVVSKMGLDPIIKISSLLGIDQDRQAWIDIFEQSQYALDWLQNSPYNSKSATKHPLEQAHKWWAEYLLEAIK
jgi:hypothetical protein